MTGQIRIAIAGHGNLGRGVEAAIAKNPDMQLVGIYTRRPAAQITPKNAATPVYPMSELTSHADRVDVLILCGGSKEDLPRQGPELAASFNTVDSFDTHARIPEYFDELNQVAESAGTVAVISTGWDPGLFSLNRLYGEAILPEGQTYTFWGRGLSQGHSDAVRRVPGVADGVQYTIPSETALAAVRTGERPELTTREKHQRECFVVLADDADAEQVRTAIETMPHYFDEYDTTVHFITAEELARDHASMPHGGRVFRVGNTDAEHTAVVEYSLTLADNPGFTASVLVAYARAAYRLAAAGERGARTVFDIAPGLLSAQSAAELRASIL